MTTDVRIPSDYALIERAAGAATDSPISGATFAAVNRQAAKHGMIGHPLTPGNMGELLRRMREPKTIDAWDLKFAFDPGSDPVADVEAQVQRTLDAFRNPQGEPVTWDDTIEWGDFDHCCPHQAANGGNAHDVWCDHWIDPATPDVEHINPAGFPCDEPLEALGCPSCETSKVVYCRTCAVCTGCGHSPREQVEHYRGESILRKVFRDMMALGGLKPSGEEER